MSNKGRIVIIIGGILGVFILFYLSLVILPYGTFKTVTEGQETSVTSLGIMFLLTRQPMLATIQKLAIF